MARANVFIALFLALIGLCVVDSGANAAVIERRAATNHAIDWTFQAGPQLPPVNAKVGDNVTFTYAPLHDVYMFKSAATFAVCDFTGARLIKGHKGPAVVPKKKAGVYYYGCNVGAHCAEYGMKVKVTAK